VAANASRLKRGDDAPGLIVSLLDVTPLRALERRARANERLAALGRMAGGLLHELRNPLTSMVLYLDLLRPLERSGEGGEILDRAIVEGQRLAAFLEDFQVFAALRPLRLERAVVCEVITAAAGALTWPENVTWRCEDRLATVARVDRHLLEHAVRNVLQNAVEALRPTGGHVTVGVERQGGDVQIAISDDGPGIPEELVERILDPMFTTKTQGTGMGLSIVQRVVEAHGGTLTVRSVRGQGATFTLRFPASDGD
jgi:signal transduction histidine kinase